MPDFETMPSPPPEPQRYARQTVLGEVGAAGQEALQRARVLLVGLGGLGCPAALYLAGAGVGTLGLADADTVSISNLHRQILYATADVGARKVDIAARQLLAINPHVRIRAHACAITPDNAHEIFSDYDIIVDGTDNFAAHYVINDIVMHMQRPLVWGNVERFAGQIGTVLPHQSACYRCIYPSPPPVGVAPACDEIGVLGPVPGIIGTLMAMEVLKVILHAGTPLAHRILRVDALSSTFKEIKIMRDKNCTACGGEKNKMLEVKNKNPDQTILPLDTSVLSSEVTATELRALLLSEQPPVLVDVRNPDEFETGHIAGAHLIPLPDLAERMHELKADADIILYCRSGGRSERALRLLQSNQFPKVRHLAGGIMGWGTDH